MIIIELLIALTIIGVFLIIFAINTRKGMIAFLTFTSLALPTFPWDIIPIPRASIIAQITVIALAFFFFGLKKILMKKSNIINKYSVLILILFLLMVIYLFISDSYDYGYNKTIFFLVKAIIPAFTISIFTPLKESDLRVINQTLMFSSYALALRILPTINTSVARLVLDSGEGPLVIARILGMGAILLLVQIASNKSVGFIWKITRILIFILLMFLMFLTGSRGPVGFVFLSTFVVLMFNKTTSSQKIMSIFKINSIIFIILIISLIILMGNNRVIGINRVFSNFAFIQKYSNFDLLQGSDKRRLDLYYTAWDGIIKSKGLGIGTGGFSSIYYNERYDYPHNLFLEVTLELGVLGFLTVFFIFVISIGKIKHLLKLGFKNIYLQGIIALTIFFILDSLISGDIGKNYPLWIMLSLLWGVNTKNHNKDLENVIKKSY